MQLNEFATGLKQPDRLGGLLLAAGQSRRMEGQNKLLADLNGKPMIRQIAETMLEAGLDDLTVVIGHEADQVASTLKDLPVKLVFNAHFAAGQGHSIATGIAALGEKTTDVLIVLGDMPLVSRDILQNLILAHLACSEHQRRITLPNYKGNRGNPVIWGAAFFPELKELRGDIGGRKLLQDHFAAHNSVEIATPAILHDIDTLSDLKDLERIGVIWTQD